MERSLVRDGDVDSVEIFRRKVRQMATSEFCATTEEILGRKVTAMLGDHNAIGPAKREIGQEQLDSEAAS